MIGGCQFILIKKVDPENFCLKPYNFLVRVGNYKRVLPAPTDINPVRRQLDCSWDFGSSIDSETDTTFSYSAPKMDRWYAL